jgi:hypothetical protein
MIYPFYEGLPLVPSRSVANELYNYNLMLRDILDVLEQGYNCAKSKRKKGTIERCLDRKRKTTRVVITKAYNYSLDSEVWVIIHVGVTTKPKRVRK